MSEIRTNRKIIQMPNYNYYKTISANMLVTTHDLNFVMGFIKEDEIYNPQSINGVRDTSS